MPATKNKTRVRAKTAAWLGKKRCMRFWKIHPPLGFLPPWFFEKKMVRKNDTVSDRFRSVFRKVNIPRNSIHLFRIRKQRELARAKRVQSKIMAENARSSFVCSLTWAYATFTWMPPPPADLVPLLLDPLLSASLVGMLAAAVGLDTRTPPAVLVVLPFRALKPAWVHHPAITARMIAYSNPHADKPLLYHTPSITYNRIIAYHISLWHIFYQW